MSMPCDVRAARRGAPPFASLPFRAALSTAIFTLAVLSGCASTWSDEMLLTGRTKRCVIDARTGVQLAYVAFGDSREYRDATAAAGLPTLVYAHGLGASKYFWSDIARLMLVQDGYRAVLVDLLGHGDSDKPRGSAHYPSRQGRYLVRFLRAQRELVGPRIVLVGTSYGALTSLEAALELDRRPEPEDPRVLGVFAVSPPAFYSPVWDEAPERASI
jgi:pimeloyl-ACP methyl ester carboxylesterase